MSTIRFLVDGAPVSTNQGYQPARWGKRHGLVLTPGGKGYKARLHLAAMMAWARAGRPQPLESAIVCVRFGFKTNGSDVDGPLKFALDCLQTSHLVVNDNRIVRVVLEKAPPGDPRTEIGIAAADV
jgi:Holliday junction resolvase RusA-like endonuclease